MSDYPNVEQCGSCHRTLEPPYRCPCTYEQPTPPASRPWRVFREGSTFGEPFGAEMMARAYAVKFGGRLEINGHVVGSWPVPEWIRVIERRAKAAASALQKVRDWKAL